jgi:hypothetical protein
MLLQTYLVEHYRPGFTAERLNECAARIRRTAVGMAREGEPVRYLRSTIVPTDESLLCLLEAASETVVREVCARAEVPLERLTAVITDDTAESGRASDMKGAPATTTRPQREERDHRPGGHMFASRTPRHTLICVIFCALLVAALGVSPAGANDRTASAALAQEKYYSSFGKPDATGGGTSAAQAQERYYSSYGEPQPLPVAQPPAPSNDTPWLQIALSIALLLAIGAAGATLGHRLRIRRRAAA